MDTEVALLLMYNERNEVIRVPSSTPIPDLLKKATEIFNIHVQEFEGRTVVLEQYHEGFMKWVRVEDDFRLPTRCKLKVTLYENGRDIQVKYSLCMIMI